MYYQEPDGVSIHDGFPNPAADASLQALDLNKLLIKNPVATFFVRSAHGDILLVDRSLVARPNDLVVWIHDDSFRVSARHAVGQDSVVWGVITATIRQYREKQT